MNGAYRYSPDDFKGILGLPDELAVFYRLHEKYIKNKTQNNRFALDNHYENLFFTIKHREVEGFLNPVSAQDLRGYLEVLAGD
ncbi:MAG: hypothetical protein FWF08_06780 [Oscillospiraceae bacterium]|nr:hypothetical protein [Oscillospiraceae bacterium]